MASTCTMPIWKSDKEKLFLFNKLMGSKDVTGKLLEEVTSLDYKKIMMYIQRDLQKQKCDKELPLGVLTVLVENSVHSIYMDVIKMLKENLIEEEVANNIMLILNNHVKQLFIHQKIKHLTTLYSAWQSYDLERFSTVLSDSFKSEDEKLLYKKNLLTQIVPYVFNVKDHAETLELVAIDLALTLASIKSIVTLTSEESRAFLNNMNRYIVITQKLRDSSFDSWPKLWMIMIKLLGTRLHTTPNLLKLMLKIVEKSFKVEDMKQKIRAFDCWKVLIENFSLDMVYFINDKRVNLVLTPLTSKSGKSDALTIKRFEVFKHLLMRLQYESLLVLKQFLIFCFGEIGETCDPKYCYAKEVPELNIGCAKVLLAILGHSHKDVGYCLETSNEIQLEPGLLESKNITHLYPILINSVVECCKLLQLALRKITRNRVSRCLWYSLMKILLQDDDKLGYVGELIGQILNNLIMRNDRNCRNLSAVIFKAIVSYDDLPKVTQIVLNQITVLVKVIFTVPLSKNSIVEIGRLVEIINKLNCEGDNPTFFKEIYKCYSKFKTVHGNADFVARLWVLLTVHLKDYAEGDSLNYLVWPVLYLNHITFTEITRMIFKQYEHKVLPSVEKSDPLHLKLFQYFKTCSMNDVAQLNRILMIITWFNPKITNKEILDITLEIIHSILLTTNTAENTQRVESYIRKLYESCVRVDLDAITMQKLYSCIEDLLKFKYFGILSDVESFLRKSPDDIKLVHNNFLTIDFLKNLSFDKETNLDIGEQISRLIDLFQNAKGTKKRKFVKRVLPSGGRSARIAALVTDISASHSRTPDKSVNDTLVPECELPSGGRSARRAALVTDISASHSRTPDKSVNDTLVPECELPSRGRSARIAAMVTDISASRSRTPDKSVNDTLVPECELPSGGQAATIAALVTDISASHSRTPDKSVNDTLLPECELPSGGRSARRAALVTDISASCSRTPDKSVNDNLVPECELPSKGRSARIAALVTGISASHSRTPDKSVNDTLVPECELPSRKRSPRIAALVTDISASHSRTPDKSLNDTLVPECELPSGGRSARRAALVTDISASCSRTPDKSVNDNLVPECELPSKGQSARIAALVTDISASHSRTPDKSVNDTLVPECELPSRKRSPRIAAMVIDISASHSRTPDKSVNDTLVPECELHSKGRSARRAALVTDISASCSRTPGKSINDNLVLECELPSKGRSARIAALVTDISASDSRTPDKSVNDTLVPECELPSRKRSPRIAAMVTDISASHSRTPDKSVNDTLVPECELPSRGRSARIASLVTDISASRIKTPDQSVNDTLVPECELPSEGQSATIAALVTDISASRSRTPDKSVNVTLVPECELKITKNTDEHISMKLKDEIKSVPKRKVGSTPMSKSPRVLRRSRRKSRRLSCCLELFTSDKKSADLTNVEHKDDDDDEIIESSQGFDNNISRKLALCKELHIEVDDIMTNRNATPKKRGRPPKSRSVSAKSMTDELIDIMANGKTMHKERGRPPKKRRASTKSMTDEEIVDISTQSEAEDTQTQETALSGAEVTTVQFKLDLPQKPILTESEEVISEMDTASILLDSNQLMDSTEKQALTGIELSTDQVFATPTSEPSSTRLPTPDVDFAKNAPPGSQEKSNAPENAKESLQMIDKAVEKVPLKSPRKDKARSKTVAQRRIFNQGSSRISLSARPELIMSPSSRTQKLMSNIKLLPLSPEMIPEVAQEEQETVLTFNRVVPSPLAVPKSSILKRKSAHSPEKKSSVAKRRRVNFSDPCITKKVLIRRDQPKISRNLETVKVDTRLNVQVGHDVPIYPHLKDCNENLSLITKHLTGTLTLEQVLCILSSNNIHTIGDLAMQSELNISRMQFIVPDVFNTLDDYYRRNFESEKAFNEMVVNEQANESLALDEDIGIEEEIIRALKRAKSKGLSIEQLLKNCVEKCCPESKALVQQFDISAIPLPNISKERGLNLIQTIIDLTQSSISLAAAQVDKVILERKDDGDYRVVIS